MSLIPHQQVHGLQKSGSSTTHPSKSSANAKEEKQISSAIQIELYRSFILHSTKIHCILFIFKMFCLQLVVHAVELNLDRLLIISDRICIHLPTKIHKTASSILSNAEAFPR